MTDKTDYFAINKMSNMEIVDAILEAHRDNDTHDVGHYANVLRGRAEQLGHDLAEMERQLAECRSTIEGLRNPPSYRKMDMSDADYIQALEQMLAEARKDSERLDWVDINKQTHGISQSVELVDGKQMYRWSIISDDYDGFSELPEFDGIRQAIDAAIRDSQTEERE